MTCEKEERPWQECMPPMQRGFTVSLRDGDRPLAEWFAGRLRSLGRSDITAIFQDKALQRSEIRVPGGISAILRIVGEKENVSREDFLRGLSKIVLLLARDKSAKEDLYESIARHFEIISELEALGQRDGDKVKIALSIADSTAGKRTQKALKLLGWEMGKSSEVQPARGTDAAKRQQTSAALALDEIAMQDAIRDHKTFTLEITDDRVPAVLGEAPWRDQFYVDRGFLGGFTQALAEDMDLAKLYAGISELDEITAEQLVRDFGLRVLHDKYADLLFNHSADLVVRNGRAVVPGGRQSEPVWEKIAGASTSNPRQFFRELLRKDDGKLIAFFSCLMRLDMPRQKFFSASATRTLHFYELFKESPEADLKNRRTTPFQDFISQVPLDSEGHIQFPGSPEVWMVAKGQFGSEEHTARLLKKVARIANPETEDAILTRLARTAYSSGMEATAELANFMAVVRVEAHRKEPLDEASALLLAQQHDYHRAIWPYVTGLSGMGSKEYSQLFRLGSRLRSLDTLTLNDVLGEFNAIAKLLCLLQEFKRIDEKQAASLLGDFCERLSQATSNRNFAVFSLEAIREIIKTAGNQGSDFDTGIRDLLIEPSGPVTWELEGKAISTKGNQERRDGYQRVLEYQKVPSFKTLFELQAVIENLASAKGTLSDNVKQLNEHLAEIQDVEFSKSSGLEKNAKENLLSLKLDSLRELTRDLGNEASKKKPDKRKLASLSNELMGKLNPQVRVALTGILYAFYFRPSDMLISEDPSFLRRHQFNRLDSPKGDSIYYPGELKSDERAGSYLIGGFADFSKVASLAALATSRKSQDAANPFAAAVLGSIRDTDWHALKDGDLRIAGLRVRVAREWILRSASDPANMNELADSIEGLLSAGRRANLLRAVSRFQWESVWGMLSAGDLFFLGEQYIARFKEESEPSPTIAALRKLSSQSDLSSLQWLGPELSSIYQCSHPHLLRLPPHENFESYLFPDKIAERSNEFMVYLAELFDRAGIPAGLLEPFAESMALKLFSDLQMTGSKDWRSVLKAYGSMNEKWIEAAAGAK